VSEVEVIDQSRIWLSYMCTVTSERVRGRGYWSVTYMAKLYVYSDVRECQSRGYWSVTYMAKLYVYSDVRECKR